MYVCCLLTWIGDSDWANAMVNTVTKNECREIPDLTEPPWTNPVVDETAWEDNLLANARNEISSN